MISSKLFTPNAELGGSEPPPSPPSSARLRFDLDHAIVLTDGSAAFGSGTTGAPSAVPHPVPTVFPGDPTAAPRYLVFC